MIHDISVYCKGEGCPFKRDCRCYEPQSEHEHYFIDTPYDIDGNECLFFWQRR